MANEHAQDIKAALLAELEANPQAFVETFEKGKVLSTIDADPKHRKTLRTMVADKYPGTAEMMPETAVDRAVAPALAAIQEERLALAKERLTAQQEKNRAAWHASLRAEGVADKDLEAVEKLATETANFDAKALAWRWKTQNTPARSSGGFGRPIIPGTNQDAFFKGIQEDPDGWLLNRAGILWEETAAGRDPDAIDWSKEVIA